MVGYELVLYLLRGDLATIGDLKTIVAHSEDPSTNSDVLYFYFT